MTNTVTLTQSAYKELVNRLGRVERLLAKLVEDREKEPPYGSTAWWEWSDHKALEDIKTGRYKSFASAKDMVKYLDKR